MLGSAIFWEHGLGKWEKLFSSGEIQFADPFGIGPLSSLALAVFAEVMCAIFLVLGLLTRPALIPLIVTMLVAILTVHLSDGFADMEKAFLYGIGFISLMFTGPGKYSLDALLKKERSKLGK